jgi:DNA-binding transcriptional ArsR family regulator
MPDTLSTTFAALADPTRRAILARLTEGETSVSELAEPFHMTMPAVTKHLKVLENAGLVARSREAQWRPCSLRAAPLKEAASWIEHYREHWEQRLDRLEAYLQKLQAEQPATTKARTTHKATHRVAASQSMTSRSKQVSAKSKGAVTKARPSKKGLR